MVNAAKLITWTAWCGSLALFTAAVGGSAYADTVSIGNPVDGNNGFGVVTEGDAMLGSTESEGPVAIGGNLSFGSGYNVAIHTPGTYTAPGDSQPTALLVGGRVNYTGSAPDGVLKVLQNGYAKIGNMAGSDAKDTDSNGAQVNTHITGTGGAYDSTPRIELTTRETESAVGRANLMDFASLFSTYRDRADTMAQCATNVTLLDGNGTALPDQENVAPGSRVKVELTPGKTNVLHVTGETLNNLNEIDFLNQPSADTPFLVVVDTTDTDGTLTWHTPTLAGVSGTDAPYMMWDFPDATDITIADGDTVEGTIYAPRANLTDLDPSNIEGDIIAKTLTAGPIDGPTGPVNAGEIHYFPFDANLECDDSSPSPSPTDTPSPTNTPTPHSQSPTPTDSTPTPSPTSPIPTPQPSTPAPSPKPTGPELANTGSDNRVVSFAAAGAIALTTTGAALAMWARRQRNSRN
ncbi:collagen-binding domain-containing protein [Streptomyces sp. BH055]|uniref:collagen-binding domain-containing protein n=1 Tax=Streptomyces sp. BH055 TaxID=3401173 RepID=UPI003BB6A6DF